MPWPATAPHREGDPGRPRPQGRPRPHRRPPGRRRQTAARPGVRPLARHPAPDGPSFWYWNTRVADLVLGTAQEESEYRASLQALVSLEDYLGALVARRRAEPGDDLISQVLQEGRVGDSVSVEEFTGMLTQMAFAGGETTSNLIANTVLALHTHPGRLAAVRAEPELAQTAVEETLRLDGPSKMSIRTAARDLDLDGHTLRAGDRIFLVTAAANRDPARFPDPGRFDVRRSGATHLGFGFGAHFCIGAALAAWSP